MKTGKKIIVLAVLVFIFLPVVTHAFSFWPLVPCGLRVQPTDSSGVELPKVPTQENPYAHDYTQPCNQCDLFKLLKNIIDFVLMGLMPPAAAILFVWGGFLILMGGANPGWITQGKSIFFNTAIGVAIISASWLLTNTIIKSLANESVTNPNTPWYQLECTVTTVGGDGNCSDGIKNGDETGIDTGGRCAVTTGKLYTCNDKEKCVEDPNGKYDNSTCDDVCAPATTNLTISTSSLSDASQGSDYSQDLSATGGTAPYTWTLDTSTPLPAGLSLEYRGTIYGKPTETGDFTFTVLLNDSKGETANKDLSIKVVAASDSVVISNVASSKITADSATITWTTNKPSTSQVAYGTTTAYGSSSTLVTNPLTDHSITLTDLTPGTTYNYQAISSITGFTVRSANGTFKTTGTVIVGNLCSQPAQLAASNNEPYPKTNAPELNTLISCIKSRLSGQSLGSEYTFDNSYELCNYTRGQRSCTASCSHAVNSCHYGGKTGTQGSLAVDFGNEVIGANIIQAAVACGVPSGKARCENAAGVNVSCASGSGATHVHVSAASCDAN